MFTKNGNKFFISSHGESSNRSSRKLMEHDTYLTKIEMEFKRKRKRKFEPRKPSFLGASY